jgi:hypothetical protein
MGDITGPVIPYKKAGINEVIFPIHNRPLPLPVKHACCKWVRTVQSKER